MVAGAGLPGRHGEAEVLQEAGEEEEELHAGQGLPEARAAACGRARGLCEPGLYPPKIPSGRASKPSTPQPQGTCGEGYEGLLLDEAAPGIQEVLRVETEGLLPDGLILQH